MNKTSIEWTHRPETGGDAGGFTWNPIRARVRGVGKGGTFCTRISPGCTNCYASVINKRFGNGLEYTVPNLDKIEFFIDPNILEEPVRRKKPATIFVGDMFDLFHEAIRLEMIEDVFLAMIRAKQHTFQVLTKRASRMQKFISCSMYRPFPHIWFGVSVESQKWANERVPLLLQTPAAIRFLSVEPMLESVNLHPDSFDGMPTVNMLTGADWCDPPIPGIDWVICGGESGPSARPFNLKWAESLSEHCRAVGVPFFMKQVGSRPILGDIKFPNGDPGKLLLPTENRKGGEPSDWPKSLRVREFPVVTETVPV